MNHLSRSALAAILLVASLNVAAQGESDSSANAQAKQDHETLQEACRALKNPQQQAGCLDALVRLEEMVALLPPRSPAELAAAKKTYLKKKYAAALGAFAALKTATARQVSFEKYGPLIDVASDEVAMLRSRAASETERQVIQSLDKALAEYRQAEKNWEAAEKFGMPASAFVVPKWRQAREAVKEAESLLLGVLPRASR